MSQCQFKRGGSRKYVLTARFVCKLHFKLPRHIHTKYCIAFANGRLVIEEGYEWDGPSGPAFDTDNFMDGSLVHDLLYQLMREGHLKRVPYRRKADKEMRIQCKKDGMSLPRRWWCWLGVRIGGHGSAGGRYPWQRK
jgi:hypothetical protein